ncbi:uncharacterized protein LOC131883019 isoform X2 [Tigriopus californicus]|nr:uncharacterized protein LOC131883019 isoform X2 [Tigriopus californicus]
MLVNADTKPSHLSPAPSASVKLRRRNKNNNNHINGPGGVPPTFEQKKKNRHSGDFLYWSPSRQIQEERRVQRKSGDWSYVSFPVQGHNGGGLNLNQGSPMRDYPYQFHLRNDEPAKKPSASILESKVIASIIQNETSRSAQGTPIRRNAGSPHPPPLPPPRCNSAMETLDRKPPPNATPVTGGVSRRKINGSGGGESSDAESNNNTNPREFGRLMSLQDDIHGGSSNLYQSIGQQGKEIYSNPMMNESPRQIARSEKTKRRSQSHTRTQNQQHSSDPFSDNRSVYSDKATPVKQKMGLGRRSATQMELSRRRNWLDDDENAISVEERSRWKSQEHLVDSMMFHNQPDSGELVSLPTSQDESTYVGNGGSGGGTCIKKGLMWQQRDRLFSRWKERYFVLSKDYLQCYKRGSSRISEMGGFIFKIKLAEIEDVELLDKRGYLTVSLTVAKEGKVLLRKPEGIREWFEALKTCSTDCRNRSMKSTEEFWNRKKFQAPDREDLDHWLLARQRIGIQYNYQDVGSNPPSLNTSFQDEFTSLPPCVLMGQNGPSVGPLERDQSHERSSRGRSTSRFAAGGSAPNSRPSSRARVPSKPRRSGGINGSRQYLVNNIDCRTEIESTSPNLSSGYHSPKIGSASSSGSASITNPGPLLINKTKTSFTETNFYCQDSGNDSMHTNTSTGGSTDSSHPDQGSQLGLGENRQARSRLRQPNEDFKDISINESPEPQTFRGRTCSEVQRAKDPCRDHQQAKIKNRRSHLPHQSTRV